MINEELPSLGANATDGYHMRSAELNELAFSTLRAFGDPWTDFGQFPLFDAWRQLNNDDNLFAEIRDEIHLQVHLDDANRDHGNHNYDAVDCRSLRNGRAYAGHDLFVHYADLNKISRSSLEVRLRAKFGDRGVAGCRLLLSAMEAQQRLDFWGRVTRPQATELLEISNLFNGGRWSNLTADGMLDQRLINYLAANLDDVARIHWRQFEKLTATYFLRRGMHVQLGPGSNDDGVDIRIWPIAGNCEGPPLMIVQCKRQRQKVSKVVVKALWADVCAENAQVGLLVTSSSASPGAEHTIAARGYGIEIADGAAVYRWIRELRAPGSGVTAL
ncbi:restriction endonuclease [Micromonospora oryzae]|uniref:restriction endonuclease n=1 Tax=Micromonospora sp. DSM 102119 TaxID=3111768 RepID=UPI0031CFA722